MTESGADVSVIVVNGVVLSCCEVGVVTIATDVHLDISVVEEFPAQVSEEEKCCVIKSVQKKM